MARLILRGVGPTWYQRAGNKFRAGLRRIAAAAAWIGIRPKDAGQLVGLKLRGVATKEYSEVVKNFNEAESARLTADLTSRVMESRVLQAEAEAHSAQINSLQAELVLRKQLQELGLTLVVDKDGRLSIQELPSATLTTSEGQILLPENIAKRK